MGERAIPIFVSVGRHYKSEEAVLTGRVSDALREFGAEPLTLPREQWNRRSPLQAISRLMRQCDGVLVIAFTRMRYEAGYEWPDSPQQASVGVRDVATVWLHIEAALSFAYGLPTLVLTERRLHAEGLLNPKHEEYRAVEYDLMACQDRLPDYIREALRAFVAELVAKQM